MYQTKATEESNFCHHIFVHDNISQLYSLTKLDSCFSCESLALQNYNDNAPDDELAIVSCLDTEACEQCLTYS